MLDHRGLVWKRSGLVAPLLAQGAGVLVVHLLTRGTGVLGVLPVDDRGTGILVVQVLIRGGIKLLVQIGRLLRESVSTKLARLLLLLL